ncbi:tRNA methyltransferase 10 homolog A-like [Lineus longissimus]|uniref:tRNA methyltransferase 10 homolog A-like n=1 Tax=Lineus longissimus TaxID=88925 RepID=UPI002B4F7991
MDSNDQAFVSEEDGEQSPGCSDSAELQEQSQTAAFGDVKLTKKQQRRLEKKERNAEMRPIWRAKSRENRKKRKAEARERGEELPHKISKKNTMANSSCSVKVVIDCSFDHLMNEREIISLENQIQRCYSTNRRMDQPLQLYVGSFNGKIKERMEAKVPYKSWDLILKDEAYHEFLEKDNIVYLSSESPNVLSELEADKAYIIGGLIDHNIHKGLCHQLAEKNQINHAQLPIREFIDMKGRKVLTIDHVFEILAKFTETKNWEESFLAALPKRKEVVGKSSNNFTLLSNRKTGEEGNVKDNETVVDNKSENLDADTVNSIQDLLSGDVNNDLTNSGSDSQVLCDSPAVTDVKSIDIDDTSCGLSVTSSENLSAS